VADTSRRGLVSWEDFTVFETVLKRPDADYWMAFQYFDVYVQFTDMQRVLKLPHLAETTPGSSTTMSLKQSSVEISAQTPYRSTLTGEQTALCVPNRSQRRSPATGLNYIWEKRTDRTF
jgi:hypothetical protein